MTDGLPPRVVIWHDAECGSYRADLPLWRGMAGEAATAGAGDAVARILDVGAGTGRVALDLAASGHDVTALDLDPDLLAALRERAAAAGLEIATVQSSAEGFDLGDAVAPFDLVLVPMQTIQLLDDRPAFLAAARRHLRPGGLLAAALADALEGYDPGTALLPEPDRAEHAGWRFASQAIAVRERPDRSTIERIRTTLAPDGRRTAEPDVIDLRAVTVEQLGAEGEAAGLIALPPRRIDPTEAHVGSKVVVLRAP